MCYVVAERTAKEATEDSQLAYSLYETCSDGFTRAAEEYPLQLKSLYQPVKDLPFMFLDPVECISWLSYKKCPESDCEKPRSKVEAPLCAISLGK